jgi:hypothetical protein
MTTQEHPIPSLVRLSSSLLVAFSIEKLAGSGSLLLRPRPIEELQPSSPQILYEKAFGPKAPRSAREDDCMYTLSAARLLSVDTILTQRRRCARLCTHVFFSFLFSCRPLLRSCDYRQAHDQ